MKILAIGAHPDDIELGCGGVLLKAARGGHDVYLCTLTRGGASGDPDQRTKESLRSGEFIGARDVCIGDFEDARLNADELINYIEGYIDKVDPDVIFAHTDDDTHHDHVAAATATREAARYGSNILLFEAPSSTNFSPKVYYDISDVIDEKIKLIGVFGSQRNKPFMTPNAITTRARGRALEHPFNIDYVEAFDVLKLCLDEGFRLTKTMDLAKTRAPSKI
jgi:LmbE family N-acetylglucosaminyl deacetylase